MIRFTTEIKKFDQQGEKTGWTYIEVTEAYAQALKPGNRKSFRVKGKLDKLSIMGVALIPMGNGGFILALNAAMRKSIGKQKGAHLQVELEVDPEGPKAAADLVACLAEEPAASTYFYSLAPSHQLYFSKWIDSAKTETTRTRRLAQTLNALVQGMDFSTMLRQLKKDKESLGF